MNERDTPETDAQGYGDGRHPYVPTDFARRLERQRDELLEELGNIARANPKKWDEEVRDQFQQWVQNRARAAIASVKGGGK